MLFNPFSSAVADAMMQENVNLVLAVEILFESGPTRVHTGTGVITIDSLPYIGIGSLGQIDPVKEQNVTNATQLNLTLGGIETSLLATILNENCVGKKASMFVGIMNDDLVMTDYDVVFRGKIRNSALLAGEKGAISITLSNIFEEWSHAKSWRYTDESQRKLNDDDRIFRYVPQMADRSIYWGSKKDAPAFIYK